MTKLKMRQKKHGMLNGETWGKCQFRMAKTKHGWSGSDLISICGCSNWGGSNIAVLNECVMLCIRVRCCIVCSRWLWSIWSTTYLGRSHMLLMSNGQGVRRKWCSSALKMMTCVLWCLAALLSSQAGKTTWRGCLRGGIRECRLWKAQKFIWLTKWAGSQLDCPVQLCKAVPWSWRGYIWTGFIISSGGSVTRTSMEWKHLVC